MVRVFLPFKDMYMMHKKSKQVKDSIFQNGGKKSQFVLFLVAIHPPPQKYTFYPERKVMLQRD